MITRGLQKRSRIKTRLSGKPARLALLKSQAQAASAGFANRSTALLESANLTCEAFEVTTDAALPTAAAMLFATGRFDAVLILAPQLKADREQFAPIQRQLLAMAAQGRILALAAPIADTPRKLAKLCHAKRQNPAITAIDTALSLIALHRRLDPPETATRPDLPPEPHLNAPSPKGGFKSASEFIQMTAKNKDETS